jgi:hypothetical protein
MDSGDGATGFSESSGNKSFTSGSAVKIEGAISTVERQYSTVSFGFPQADGIYFENRATSGVITLKLNTDASTTSHTFAVPPSGVIAVRFDASQTAITFVSVVADSGTLDYVLCLAE